MSEFRREIDSMGDIGRELMPHEMIQACAIPKKMAAHAAQAEKRA